MSPNLTVVHALAPARVGGLESVVASLAGGMARRGHDVHVAAVVEPDVHDHEFLADLARRGVPARRVEVPHRAYHVEARRLHDVFAELSPDLVHTHGYRADVMAGALSRWMGLPVVSSVHGFTGGGRKNRLYEWLQRRALRRHAAVVAVSEPIRRRLLDRGLEADRVRLVRNAWARDGRLLERDEARDRLGLPPDAFVVGFVGRLSREKGPDVLLEAFSRLADGDRRAVASVLGEGEQRERLEAVAGKLGVGGRVRFHGRVPRAAELYRAFDVFALSSRTEGTPVSLFEAMEAEVPAVATRVGGVPDVVRHGREALLVEAEDPAALADALGRVRRDPEAARDRARRARRRLETEFDAESWLDSYEGIYEEVAIGR